MLDIKTENLATYATQKTLFSAMWTPGIRSTNLYPATNILCYCGFNIFLFINSKCPLYRPNCSISDFICITFKSDIKWFSRFLTFYLYYMYHRPLSSFQFIYAKITLNIFSTIFKLLPGPRYLKKCYRSAYFR